MPMPHRWPRCFYTYIMYDPEGMPYYVGAGKNSRANPKRKMFDGVCLEKEFRTRSQHTLTIVIEQESREIAFEEERRFIKQIGRRDLGTGPLYNRTDGHGSHGRVWTDEERAKSRAAKLGTRASLETKTKLSKRMQGNQYLLGHVHSEETKKKISENNRGRKLVLTEQEKQRRASHTLTLNAGNRKGQRCSDEHRQKLSEAAKRRHTPCM